jgi:hypothetical protein
VPHDSDIVKRGELFKATAFGGILFGTERHTEGSEAVKGEVKGVQGVDGNDSVRVRVGGDERGRRIVEGEELDDALSRFCDPVNEREEVSKITYAITVFGTQRKKRNDSTYQFNPLCTPERETANEEATIERKRIGVGVQASIVPFFPQDEAGLGVINQH